MRQLHLGKRGLYLAFKSGFLKCFVSVLLLLSAFTAHALTLGEVQVHSKLNEPLAAEIEVLTASSAEIGSLRIGLAGEQDWKRAGLVAQGSASKIRFGFMALGNGNLVVTLKTDAPVREPLLVFLLDAAWNNGHILREYTVFLDPVGSPSNDYAQVLAPTLGGQPEASADFANADQIYGPVRAGETLSTISEQLIAGTDLRRSQMAWALFKNNPQAFNQYDINSLVKGANLAVPSYQDVAAINSREAMANIVVRASGRVPHSPVESSSAPENKTPISSAEQQAADAQSDSPPPKELPTSVAAAPASPAPVDKLELLPLEDGAATDEVAEPPKTVVAAGASPNGSFSVAQNAMIEDQSSNRRERELGAENALLRERITETEALLKEIRSLLAARSEQLADLQQRLDTIEQSNQRQAAPVAEAPVATPAIGWIYWVLLALAIVILCLLVVLLFLLTRRQQRDEVSPKLYQETEDEPPLMQAPVSTVAAEVDDDASAEPTEVVEPEAEKVVTPKLDDTPPWELPAAVVGDESEPEEASAEATQAEDHHSEESTPAAEVDVTPAVEVDIDMAPEANLEGPSADSVLGEQRATAEDSPLEFSLDEATAGLVEADEKAAVSFEADSEQPQEYIDLPEFTIPPSEDDSTPMPPAAEDDLVLDLPEIQLEEPTEAAELDSFADDDRLEDSPLPELVDEAASDNVDFDVPAEEVPVLTSDAAVDVSDFSSGDQVATKLDLARVYADMGNAEEAQSILQEVLRDGNEAQQKEAQAIIDGIA